MHKKIIDELILVGMDVYANDVKLRYTTMREPVGGERGNKDDITELSRKSLQNLVFLVQNTSVEFAGMITLTYPSEYPHDGKEAKRHLNRFLSWMRAGYCTRYVWFLEFQKRGAPHFHILTEEDMSPHKTAVSEAWYRAVGSNDVKHLRAGTRTEKIRQSGGAKNYAAKYGAKREQKRVPPQYANVGRFWGASRGVKPEPVKCVDVYDMQTVIDTLDSAGWEYTGILKENNISILYNAGKALVESNGTV